jgi:phenylalanine-4-hydroxylase
MKSVSNKIMRKQKLERNPDPSVAHPALQGLCSEKEMSAVIEKELNDPKARFRKAPRGVDFTIDQDWPRYTAAEHNRWDRLFKRSLKILRDRACDEFVAMIEKLKLSESGIPDMEKLNERLAKLTGWRVVPVIELVPDNIFFSHLANRRFPAGAFIRSETEMDYLQEPDVFHDIFGHVPLLANPVYANFMQAYGQGGNRALALGRLANLARLYWYTIEFGLIRTDAGLRIFGAGIMSSVGESVFALENDSPNRITFNLERVMRTKYVIDDFQEIYFVVDSFEKLLQECYQDFGPLYERMKTASDIAPDQLIEGDEVISRGTLDYFRRKRSARAP